MKPWTGRDEKRFWSSVSRSNLSDSERTALLRAVKRRGLRRTQQDREQFWSNPMYRQWGFTRQEVATDLAYANSIQKMFGRRQ